MKRHIKHHLYLTLVCFLVLALQLGAQTTSLSGRIVGSDAKPMPQAHISLLRLGAKKADTTLQTSSDGGFLLTLSKPGLFLLQCTGVNHSMTELPVLIEKGMREEVQVQLAPLHFGSRIDSVTLVGKFNNYNFNTGLSMKYKDGAYRIQAPDKEEDFAYQVIVHCEGEASASMHSINGTASDDYEYDGGGDYRSILNTTKNTTIVFDPTLMPRVTAAASFSFKNPAAQQMALVYTEMMNFRRAYRDSSDKAMKEFERKGGETSKFNLDNFNATQKLGALCENIAARIAKEDAEGARKMLYLYYLSIPSRNRENAIMEKALREISPASPLWAIEPSLLYTALSAKQNGGKESYIADILQNNQEGNVVATVAYNELMQASVLHNQERAKEMYKLLSEKYPDHQLTTAAKYYYNAASKIQVGNKLPAFSITALEKGKKISSESLKGKYTLIDFWATWCQPCVKEMPVLHRAYEKFKGKNFQILSLSFDQKSADIEPFREKKWKMPWLHAFVEKGFESDMAKEFDIIGIPKPILVAPDGTILAMDFDVRGEQLEHTLAEFIK